MKRIVTMIFIVCLVVCLAACGGDQGADLILKTPGIIYVVQAKFYGKPVGNKAVQEVVAAVRKSTKLPLIVKLAPNVPSVVPYVRACEDAGADALSLINTLPAMVIDIERRKPVLANKTGGLSGRGIHPAAVKLVYDAHAASKLPILAMGGVAEAKDAIEFLLAGATAVAVGTATFSDPGTAGAVYDGIADYCERHEFSSVAELTGNLLA